ncbi:hypothetical protein [Bauldia litoralis]|uniref:hypothetical protein n=1 Tax=Bauldia litoralis TaxID=665467 RepID=UPI0032648364
MRLVATSVDFEGLAMTIPERINRFLTERKPSIFCDGCIAKNLDLSKPQEAQRVTSAFETTSDFVREYGVCSLCGEVRLAIRRA